jgi:hypothetical protein
VLKSSLLDPLSEMRRTIQATRADGDLSRRSPLAGSLATHRNGEGLQRPDGKLPGHRRQGLLQFAAGRRGGGAP